MLTKFWFQMARQYQYVAGASTRPTTEFPNRYTEGAPFGAQFQTPPVCPPRHQLCPPRSLTSLTNSVYLGTITIIRVVSVPGQKPGCFICSTGSGGGVFLGKKYKDKLCAYCAEAESTSADHIFAREFFLPQHRSNLPKVPACGQCNRLKSEIEHYLTTMLPFGGRQETAAENLEKMVPKRLDQNIRLRRTLRENSGTMWVEEQGLQVPALTLPIEPSRLLQLFEYIARGLAVYHWETYLDRSVKVEVLALTEAGEQNYNSLLQLDAAARVKVNLGEGTFVYEGAQAVDKPQITVWRFEPYGGLHFADSRQPGDVSSCFGAFSTFTT